MCEITADAVRELRQLTGCGLNECKKALEQTTSMDHAARFLATVGLAVLHKCGNGCPSGSIDARGEVCRVCGRPRLLFSTKKEWERLHGPWPIETEATKEAPPAPLCGPCGGTGKRTVRAGHCGWRKARCKFCNGTGIRKGRKIVGATDARA